MYWKLWTENQVSIRAAALTYTFILGLVPALAITLWFFSLFAGITSLHPALKHFLLKNLSAGTGDTVVKVLDQGLQTELKGFLLKNLATGTGEAVVNLLDQGLRNVRFKTIGVAGFGGMFVTGVLLLAAIQDSMNKIWRSEVKQRVWTRFLLYQAFFSLGPIGVALAMAILAALVKFFPHFLFPARLASVALATLLFTMMYKLLPAVYVQWKNAAIAGLLAAIAIECAKAGYGVYTAKALFYSKVYGTLAALPFFLIWIYLNWTIFLAGTQLNYILDNSRKLFPGKDTVS